MQTHTERGKTPDNGKPKDDRILAPIYLDAVSIGEFSNAQGHGDAPRGDAGHEANEQGEQS